MHKMAELFHEAGPRLSSTLLYRGRELPNKETPLPSQSDKLGGERVNEATADVLRKPVLRSHMASHLYPCSIYRATWCNELLH